MSKPIDYSKFDNIHDSDSDGDGDGEESESIQNEATTNTPTSTTTVTPAVTVTAPTPMMATRQDSETGRYIFECNGHKVYEWDQNLEEVNLYIAAPRRTRAAEFQINIQAKRLQVGIRNRDRFFVDEDTFSKVDTMESSWYLDEDEGKIHIILIKAHRGEVWDAVLLPVGA